MLKRLFYSWVFIGTSLNGVKYTVMKIRRATLLLLLIMALGAGIRFWGLASAELTFDEGLDAFRSIGYLDYLDSADQSTPIQWFEKSDLPLWTKFSFHDDPPLFFLIQYFFLSLLGDTLFAARLPSAVAGVASIFLFYLIGRILFRKLSVSGTAPPKSIFGISMADVAGLLAAFLASISFVLVWVSRLSMLESVSFFFILLNFYYFIRFSENRRYAWHFGLTLGLAFLTKYTTFFLVPTYGAFLLITRSPLLRTRRLYGAILISLILFSPVVIYNLYLYRTFGHFDLQFSYLFHQKTLEWQGTSGKTQEPFSNILENLSTIYSLPFLIAAFLGLIAAVGFKKFFSSNREATQLTSLVVLSFIFITILLFVIGSAIRFSVLYVMPAIFFIIFIAMIFLSVPKYRWLACLFIAIFLANEAFFSVSRTFLYPPRYGVVELDRYFDAALGKNPVLTGLITHPNPHLNQIIQTYTAGRQATLLPTGIIYDDNLALVPRLWLFSRRQFYHGIPIMPASVFEAMLGRQSQSPFRGYTLYFVKTGPGAPLDSTSKKSGAEVEDFFKKSGQAPQAVFKDGDDFAAFTVYRFSL